LLNWRSLNFTFGRFDCDRSLNKFEQLENFMKLNLSLPSDFFQQHKDLEELDLYQHNLVTLPPEIGHLKNLRYLSIEGNEHSRAGYGPAGENNLTALPPEIGQMENLQELSLAENLLTALPPEIGQLHNLQKLDLRWNKLTAIPPEIGQLRNLQELDLSDNQLTALPPEIGQLHNLQELDLGWNKLTALSPEIGQLQNLQKIDLMRNQLKALPPEIAQLQNLKEISLRNNPIQDLSALSNHPNQELKVWVFGVEISRKYWTHLIPWKAEWLLSEKNAEIRRLLIQQIGYDRICEELQTIELDSWREYTLLKIDDRVDVEPIHLLKMACPSTNHIHVLRVPPNFTSAREAIRWVNWDVDPEAFATET
jgi:Leucine-rich repeat (LRR) protein